MKAGIREKIEAALRRKDEHQPEVCREICGRPQRPAATELAHVRSIVDSLKSGEKTLSIREIATRHGLSDSTVRREFKGKLGCFQIRSKWVVIESLYTAWLTETVLGGVAQGL